MGQFKDGHLSASLIRSHFPCRSPLWIRRRWKTARCWEFQTGPVRASLWWATRSNAPYPWSSRQLPKSWRWRYKTLSFSSPLQTSPAPIRATHLPASSALLVPEASQSTKHELFLILTEASGLPNHDSLQISTWTHMPPGLWRLVSMIHFLKGVHIVIFIYQAPPDKTPCLYFLSDRH